MILSFVIKNFRSIENQTFNLTVESKINKSEGKHNNIKVIDTAEILNSAIIYGRNASGKSNFLNAFKAFKFLVINSGNYKHGERIEVYEPFTFDLLLNNKPIEFELSFITKNNLKFKYKISFDKEKIISESLYFFQSNKPSKLFLREYNKAISFGDYYFGERKKIELDLLPNQLFLSKAATRNIQFLKEAYLFFFQELEVYIFHESDVDDSLISFFAKLIFESENQYFKDNINSLLKASDVNITDFKVNKQDSSQFKFPDYIPLNIKEKFIEKFEFQVVTTHKLFEGEKEIGESSLNLHEESLGTKRLLIVGGLIIQALSNGGIIIIDELDKGLHPLLSKLLIQLFHSKKNNPNNAQLIFASHDSSLLDSDIFRRDQIYFTEKDYTGKSMIYRLSDIKGVRKDIPYDKWYLSGRFNAIPILEDLEVKFEKIENEKDAS